MSIISDALRKHARETQAKAQPSLQSHETSTSGRWNLLRELETKNAELRALLDHREEGSDDDVSTPVSEEPERASH